MTKVGVLGARGRMGREVVRVISEATDLEVAAINNPAHSLSPTLILGGVRASALPPGFRRRLRNYNSAHTGRKPGEFQVRVGQGEIEYGRIVNLLERNGHDRALTVSILDSLDSPFEVEVEVRKLKLLLESLI